MTRSLLVILAVTFVALPTVGSAVDTPVPAKVHILKPTKLSKVVNKPLVSGSVFPIPAPGGSSDPTLTGGSITWCRLDVPGACQTFALPAGGWKALGNPAGSKGYKYKGIGSFSDPCKSVLIKEKVIKASCKREDLATPVGGAGVSLELSVGTDRYCAESSDATVATVKKNDSKVWKAIKAGAPACPTAPTPVCGNAIVESGEECDGGSHCTAGCTFIPMDLGIACCFGGSLGASCVDDMPFGSACITVLGGSKIIGASCVTTPDPCPGGPGTCPGMCDVGATFPAVSVCCQGPGSCYEGTASSSADLAGEMFFCAISFGEPGTLTVGVCEGGTICAAAP